MALAGLKAIEFAGLAPGPFAGLILADNGAEVIRVDKPSSSSNDILCRGKRSIAIDAKTNSGRDVLKKLISTADVLIDPFRPGVLERLGLGPEVFLGNANRKGANERLIYARIAGSDPIRIWLVGDIPAATLYQLDSCVPKGHDINYIALSGILSMLPGTSEKPAFPVNLLADFAGGGLMCVLGILLALITRSNGGRGQVVDIDMVSGTRYLSSFPLLQTLLPNSAFSRPRGENLLDDGAPFYGIYTCKDKGLMTVGCLEPQFFEAFIKNFLGALPNGFTLQDGWRPTARSQGNQEEWPKLKEFITRGFQTNTRRFWTDIFHGTDACVVPVLSPKEASEHEAFRSPYPQPHPAILGLSPVYKGTVSEATKLQPGSHTKEILGELGLTVDELQRLAEDRAIENTLRYPKTRL